MRVVTNLVTTRKVHGCVVVTNGEGLHSRQGARDQSFVARQGRDGDTKVFRAGLSM